MPEHSRLAVVTLAGLLLVAAPPLLQAQAPTSRQRVLDAMTLPRLATDLRDEGASDYEVRDALDAMRGAGVPAADAMQALRAEFEARQRHPGPAQRFNLLVREQLRAGVRGKALAAAITRLRAHPPAPKSPKELR